MLDAVWRDAIAAVRSFRRSRGFAAAAIVTLACGIGATTAVFSVVNAALLRPLPYDDPDELVVLWQEYVSRGWGIVAFSAPNLDSYARQTTSFRALAGMQFQSVALTDVAEPEMVVGAAVTPNAFDVLGVAAALGRTFTRDDAAAGAAAAVVLSDRIWRTRFGADASLIGRTLTLNGRPTTVLGVMPREFAFPPRFRTSVGGSPVTVPATDLWLPLALDTRAGLAGTRNLFVIGRLADGVTLEAARQEAAVIAPRLLDEFPGPANVGLAFALRPFHEQVAGNARTPLLILLGAVALVVTIACANVSSMLMARGISRRGELAIRVAIGASRGHLVRQALVESLLLAGAGGAAGLLLASWIARAFSTSIASQIPQLDAIPVDGRVYLFAAGLTLTAGVVFGLLPALRASAAAVRERLPGASGHTGGAVRLSHGRFLVIGEAALSALLLVAAGLLARSFFALVSVDPGFDPSRTSAVQLELPVSRYETAGERRLFHEQLVSRLAALPVVEAVGITNRIPLVGGTGNGGLTIEGRDPAADERPHAAQHIVDAGYFSAMGMPVLRGRGFDETDRPGSPAVAIVNRTASQRFWPGEDPIGRRIRPDGVPGWLTIVGVVEDVRHASIAAAPEPEVYWPFIQLPVVTSPDATTLPIGVVIRGRTPADALTSSVRRELRALDPGLPVAAVGPLTDLVSESIAESRLYAAVMALFAGFGLLVAASGLYGVVSFLVARRRHEMGVRLALGALRRQVIVMVLRDGAVPVVAGVAIGMSAAIAGRRAIGSMLYGVTPADPVTLTAVPLLILAVAVCACYVPARRASRIDPAITLRAE